MPQRTADNPRRATRPRDPRPSLGASGDQESRWPRSTRNAPQYHAWCQVTNWRHPWKQLRADELLKGKPYGDDEPVGPGEQTERRHRRAGREERPSRSRRLGSARSHRAADARASDWAECAGPARRGPALHRRAAAAAGAPRAERARRHSPGRAPARSDRSSRRRSGARRVHRRRRDPPAVRHPAEPVRCIARVRFMASRPSAGGRSARRRQVSADGSFARGASGSAMPAMNSASTVAAAPIRYAAVSERFRMARNYNQWPHASR